jgi:hypothetical protein
VRCTAKSKIEDHIGLSAAVRSCKCGKLRTVRTFTGE